MTLVELDGIWVNPDRIAYLEQRNGDIDPSNPNGPLIPRTEIDFAGSHVFVNLSRYDIIQKLAAVQGVNP